MSRRHIEVCTSFCREAISSCWITSQRYHRASQSLYLTDTCVAASCFCKHSSEAVVQLVVIGRAPAAELVLGQSGSLTEPVLYRPMRYRMLPLCKHNHNQGTLQAFQDRKFAQIEVEQLS